VQRPTKAPADVHSVGQLVCGLPPQHNHTVNGDGTAGTTYNTRPSHLVSDIHCTEINVQHSKCGTANLCKYIAASDTTVAFV